MTGRTLDLDLIHGGALDHMQSRFPGAPKPWVDLSTGINPWPYPRGRLEEEVFTHLPTRDAFEACRGAMAGAFGAPMEALLPIPGSELIIRLLPLLLKGPADRPQVTIAWPTYGDHRQAWTAAGARLEEPRDPVSRAGHCDVVVVCNPNNPDGRTWPRERLEIVRADLARRGGWLIVDEAYADLDPALSMAPLGGREGLIVLRSFGKFFGLAGVRLGALIAPPDVLGAAAQVLGQWSVSGPALALGARAYQDTAWQEGTRRRLTETAGHLDTVLAGAGLSVEGGTSLFRFVQCPDADGLWQTLAQNGIYGRRFPWSRTHLRLGLPASQTALERLAQALGATP